MLQCEKEYNAMVEGNWLVKSGKKTIEEVRQSYNTLSFNRPDEKAEKMYKNWLANKNYHDEI